MPQTSSGLVGANNTPSTSAGIMQTLRTDASHVHPSIEVHKPNRHSRKSSWERQRSLTRRDVALAIRLQDEVQSLQDENKALKSHVDKAQRQFHAEQIANRDQRRTNRVLERKIQLLRGKMHSLREGSGAQKRALEEELEELRVREGGLVRANGSMELEVLEARRERDALSEDIFAYKARIAELEHGEALRSSMVGGSSICYVDSEDQDPEEDLLLESIIGELEKVAAALDYMSQQEESDEEVEGESQELQAPFSKIHFNDLIMVDEGIQTIPAEALNHIELELRQRCHELEVTGEENVHRLHEYQTQESILLSLVDESRRWANSVEEGYDELLSCKDLFLHDLQEKNSELCFIHKESRARIEELEAELQDSQDKLLLDDDFFEMMEVRERLEGAERNAVLSTNRIVQLEAETSDTREKLIEAGVVAHQLRRECKFLTERVEELEAEAGEMLILLDSADSLVVHLRQELQNALLEAREMRNAGGNIDMPTIDEEEEWGEKEFAEADTLPSDEGSIDTLIADFGGAYHRVVINVGKVLDTDSPDFEFEEFTVPANEDEATEAADFWSISPSTPVEALEALRNDMILEWECKTPGASRVCKHGVEEPLHAKSQVLEDENEPTDGPFQVAWQEFDMDGSDVMEDESQVDELENLPSPDSPSIYALLSKAVASTDAGFIGHLPDDILPSWDSDGDVAPPFSMPSHYWPNDRPPSYSSHSS
ncbi:hypothetical protein EW146_g4776 [Bondarzewia mesenterica]|uniref:Uncharacterized protein n=1 Tax=Bondarzewia mesenterica TaxID=1095465 RepID=A0A4S4LVB2_9AGAM|nr:hypothetical protein EW146_g4776 [Bondarzewia mesenterica]